MTIQLDGSLVDWSPTDRLERPTTTVAGYQVFGRFENGVFYFALQSPVAIGANTTLWLNTDDSLTTGFQAFGGTSDTGAEFNINFDGNGVPFLYTGGAGQNLVADQTGLAYALSADKLTLEIAVPRALLGANVNTVSILADLNDTTFLPAPYANGGYRISDPASQEFDGVLNEWTQAQRLELPATSVAGYEIYGKYASGEFDFAIKSNIVIGADTTFWFDTDKNPLTGYQAFGGVSDTGAEYNVNIGQDGVARLYSGAAGQNFVGNIQWAIGPDYKTIEFSLPKTLIGASVTTVSMKADVDNPVDTTIFLPGSYAAGKYTVTDPASLPPPVTPADGYRIAIVYSETSANNYFSKTAYSQLFMAAQNQAMAAGIPFDVLSELDLTTGNLTNLAGYDAIVFPFFRYVDSSHYQEIASVLHTLVYDHAIPLITGGEFMTNDQTGAALPGNAYERMVDLLGVNRVGGELNVTDTVIAGNTPITSGYGDGATIHTYTGAGTNYFDPTNPYTSTVIATQLVNGTSHNGVLGTVTGGHNVSFSSEALLADSNLLGKAIDWATAPDGGPHVSLHMTRDASIVASRTDVDQAQEQADVSAGILSDMVSILAGLKTQYNFVGSYYVDLGFYPNDGQTTDWSTSGPLYQQLLAMGNEIGSHSYTHPDNTNWLLPNVLTQTILDQIKAAYNHSGDFTPYALRDNVDQQVINQLRTMGLAEINTQAGRSARRARSKYARYAAQGFARGHVHLPVPVLQGPDRAAPRHHRERRGRSGNAGDGRHLPQHPALL